MTAEERARRIVLVLMDVDGTLTDGTLIVMPDGEELKTYHVRDGLGILLARMAGLDLGIITGKTSKGLEKTGGEAPHHGAPPGGRGQAPGPRLASWRNGDWIRRRSPTSGTIWGTWRS